MEPTLRQYCNRFIEWFDLKDLEVVEEMFFDMVQRGQDPEQAFRITIKLYTV